jgi:deoxyribose-phosphate aldolase
MIIAVGADHGGRALKARLASHLGQQGHEVLDFGTSSDEAVDYPDFARAVAAAVAGGQAALGIMVDGAGIGSAMVANKIPGVRAALAYDLSSARNSREHNDANLLTLGAGLIGPNLATQIVDVFLSTQCQEDRHRRRVAKIDALDAHRTTASAEPAPTSVPGMDRLVDLSAADRRRVLDRLSAFLDAGSAGTAPAAVSASRGGSTGEPGPAAVDPAHLAAAIDHTILKPDATRNDVLKICAEALEYRFKSVCVHPCWARVVTHALRGSGVLTCCVVGFPLGANAPDTKALEARRAIRDGAREIDMVINIGALKGGEDDAVLRDIRSVVEACRDGSALCKVIIETALLNDDEKIRACQMARRARAHFVKTSTGFAKGGATVEDVALMASQVRDAGLEVKASGGIRTGDDAWRMIEAGATRLGTSGSVAIVQDAGVVAAGAY